MPALAQVIAPFSAFKVLLYYVDNRTMVERPAMDRTVAHLNVEHYRKLLTQEMDETRRQTILRLLAEEEAKVASLSRPFQERKRCG